MTKRPDPDPSLGTPEPILGMVYDRNGVPHNPWTGQFYVITPEFSDIRRLVARGFRKKFLAELAKRSGTEGEWLTVRDSYLAKFGANRRSAVHVRYSSPTHGLIRAQKFGRSVDHKVRWEHFESDLPGPTNKRVPTLGPVTPSRQQRADAIRDKFQADLDGPTGGWHDAVLNKAIPGIGATAWSGSLASPFRRAVESFGARAWSITCDSRGMPLSS